MQFGSIFLLFVPLSCYLAYLVLCCSNCQVCVLCQKEVSSITILFVHVYQTMLHIWYYVLVTAKVLLCPRRKLVTVKFLLCQNYALSQKETWSIVFVVLVSCLCISSHVKACSYQFKRPLASQFSNYISLHFFRAQT
jgi:hypothetical protein